jgi:hypothetical protein
MPLSYTSSSSSSTYRVSPAATAALEAVHAVAPSLLVGEVWLPSPPSSSSYSSPPAPWSELAAFYSPTPLVASHPAPAAAGAAAGAPPPQPPPQPQQTTIDLRVARLFAQQHSLSLRLAAAAARSGRLEWSSDFGEDELLRRLTFDVVAAVAVPVFAERQGGAVPAAANASGTLSGPAPGGAPAPSCAAVMVLYFSKQREEVRFPPTHTTRARSPYTVPSAPLLSGFAPAAYLTSAPLARPTPT